MSDNDSENHNQDDPVLPRRMRTLADLDAAASALSSALRAESIPHAFCGGYWAVKLGRQLNRMTEVSHPKRRDSRGCITYSCPIRTSTASSGLASNLSLLHLTKRVVSKYRIGSRLAPSEYFTFSLALYQVLEQNRRNMVPKHSRQ
jgi:hypothetical protein